MITLSPPAARTAARSCAHSTSPRYLPSFAQSVPSTPAPSQARSHPDSSSRASAKVPSPKYNPRSTGVSHVSHRPEPPSITLLTNVIIQVRYPCSNLRPPHKFPNRNKTDPRHPVAAIVFQIAGLLTLLLAVFNPPTNRTNDHCSLSFETESPQIIHSKRLIHSYFP